MSFYSDLQFLVFPSRHSGRSLCGADFQSDHLSDPPSRPLVTRGHDSEWTLSGVQKFTVSLVREDDFPGRERWINLRQGENDFVAVCSLDQQRFAQSGST